MTERESLYLWSQTANSNATADPSINWAEGQLPATVNNSAREMMSAVARFIKDTNGSLSTAGSANAYTLSIFGTQTAYAGGQVLSFTASFTNTGAATINVSNADATALGAKALRQQAPSGDIALFAGQIVSGLRYMVQYLGTANSAAGGWIVLNPTPVGYSALNASPSAPTGTNSVSALMMGMGGTCAITPTFSGRFRVTFDGSYFATGGTNNGNSTVRYGTGTAPANGAAATGTAIGVVLPLGNTATGTNTCFSQTRIITGLTVGTAVWLDLSISSNNVATTINITSMNCTVTEF